MYYQFMASSLVQYGVRDYPRMNDVSFIVGTVIKQDLAEPLRFPADTTAEHPPADYTEMVIPVMSDRLLAALRGAGVDNLQSFAAILENPETSEVWTGYNAVNVIGTVSCADLARSEFAEIGGGLLDFSWLVIDPKRAKGALFFRLAEAPDMIIAHRTVGDYLFDPKRPKLSGFRFYPASAEDVAKMRREAQF